MTGHVYLSTACWHAGITRDQDLAAEMHLRCRKACKWCEAPCHCACHDRPRYESFITRSAGG